MIGLNVLNMEGHVSRTVWIFNLDKRERHQHFPRTHLRRTLVPSLTTCPTSFGHFRAKHVRGFHVGAIGGKSKQPILSLIPFNPHAFSFFFFPTPHSSVKHYHHHHPFIHTYINASFNLLFNKSCAYTTMACVTWLP